MGGTGYDKMKYFLQNEWKDEQEREKDQQQNLSFINSLTSHFIEQSFTTSSSATVQYYIGDAEMSMFELNNNQINTSQITIVAKKEDDASVYYHALRTIGYKKMNDIYSITFQNSVYEFKSDDSLTLSASISSDVLALNIKGLSATNMNWTLTINNNII